MNQAIDPAAGGNGSLGRVILLTGGTGFIGQRLLPALLEGGARVRLLYRPRAGRSFPVRPGLAPVPGDLTDPASLDRAMEGVSAVCHVGGLIAAPSERAFRDVNEVGTGSLARAAARRG